MRFKDAFLAATLALTSLTALADDSQRIGNRFINIDVSSNTLTQIIAPSINTAGIYIRTATISNSGAVTLLYASSTAPVAVRDLSTRTIFESAVAPSGGWTALGQSLYVPAGMGIWLGATSPASIIMTYDVVS